MSPVATRPQSDRVSDATPALQRRRQTSRRRRVLKIVLPLLALAVIAAGIWLVGFSSVLAVRTVRVSGTAVLSQSTVEQTAAVPIGTPMARLDLAGISDRVRTLREVDSVSVERSWPSAVTIAVTERQPAILIQQPGGYLLVDKHGVAFRLDPDKPSGQVVANLDPTNQTVLAEVAGVMGALPASIRSQVQSVQAQTQDSVVLSLTKGRTVFWGDGERSEDKIRVLGALLQHPGSRYDVSAPDAPAIQR